MKRRRLAVWWAVCYLVGTLPCAHCLLGACWVPAYASPHLIGPASPPPPHPYAPIGPRSSALVGGYTSWHRDLEAALARLKGTQDCLLFPTGFAANLAVASSLCRGSNVVLLSDELNHASIVDGARLGRRDGAKLLVYRHNDLAHLEQLLQTECPPGRDAHNGAGVPGACSSWGPTLHGLAARSSMQLTSHVCVCGVHICMCTQDNGLPAASLLCNPHRLACGGAHRQPIQHGWRLRQPARPG